MQDDYIENLAKNLVFIDGITRCGKSIFSSIISSFEDMEHIQVFNLLEKIIPSVKLGGVSKDYAKMILRLELNELSYNLQLSRNVNFRKEDQTGVENYKEPKVYLDRLEHAEGDGVVSHIRTHDIFIPFQTHDIMTNIDIINDIDLDCKIIEIYRDPIDNIYSWWTQGWGERFGKDPRSFKLLIPYKKALLPWFCHGYEERLISLNPYERCVVMGVDLIRRSISKQKKNIKKDAVMTILFENMVQSPDLEINRIESFLGKNRTKHTSKFVLKSGCPRVIDPKEREKKINLFKENTNKEIFDSLMSLSEYYKNEAYGLL